MKTAAITVALALGLSLSGAYAQNANDRPGSRPAGRDGELAEPARLHEQSPAGSANNRRQSGKYQIHGRASGGGITKPWSESRRRARRLKDKSITPIVSWG